MKYPTRLVLPAAVIAAITGYMAYHQNTLNKEKKEIAHAYGKRIPVYGKHMNVEIVGQGEKTIILYPGTGDPSPVLSFRPLAYILQEYYTVITIEPFGYGLSDDTDFPRTIENQVKELHECIQQLNLESYILCGHSLGGLIELYYMNLYPHEVKAYIGIDSTPADIGEYVNMGPSYSMVNQINHTVNQMGLFRLLYAMKPENFFKDTDAYTYSPEEKKLYKKVLLTRSFTENMRNEMNLLSQNLKKCYGLQVPRAIPAYYMLATKSDELLQKNGAKEGTWFQLHKKLMLNEESKLDIITGPHSLQTTYPTLIGEKILLWLSQIKK